MIVTTYQHDYVSPKSKRYDFKKDQSTDVSKNNETESQNIKEVNMPKMPEKPSAMEWTGIAPMGRLIDPRLIPMQYSTEQLDDPDDCHKVQPNRFLKILRTTYPDLYERLKVMPKDELQRRLERQRLFTTYQIDFCNINEYPEGVYESLANKDETEKVLGNQEPCAEIRTDVLQALNELKTEKQEHDFCLKPHKPIKSLFADSTRFINSGNNSHWGHNNIFSKKANFSEYMDTINKNGCVIMKNKIHDHQKCVSYHCKHHLVHACPKLK